MTCSGTCFQRVSSRGGTIAALGVACCAQLLASVLTASAAESGVRDELRRYVSQRTERAAQSAKPPPGFSTSVEQVIGLEYAVMLHKDGVDDPVDPESHRFRAGDQIRLRIQPFSDLYIYVFFQDGRGRRLCLLPNDKNSPRLARPDQPVELPSDGSVFEFEAAAEQETLTLVATAQPDGDLTSLCELVYKKRDDRLTPEERSRQVELKSKNDKALAAIQDRRQKAVIFRGRLSDAALGRLSAEMSQRGAEDALVEEPPMGKQTSTLVVMFSKATTPPKLAVTIPLKATGAADAPVPRENEKPLRQSGSR